MLTLSENSYVQHWRSLGQQLPTPTAVLVISAHWMTEGSWLTEQTAPPTLHDFGGFPQALFDVRYPAPGLPDLARTVVDLLGEEVGAGLSSSWGLDHGAWCVLRHMHPDARVPVVQLSLDALQSPSWHLAQGRRLTILREQGVLILGSGNLVHNLARVRWQDNAPPYSWAVEADEWLAARIQARDYAALCDFDRFPESVRMAIPTPEHYLPLLYVLGAMRDDDTVDFPIQGMDLGSISMRSCLCQRAATR